MKPRRSVARTIVTHAFLALFTLATMFPVLLVLLGWSWVNTRVSKATEGIYE